MTNTLKVNGAQLRYAVEGQGRPILVVGSAIYYPRTFSDHLKKQFQLAHVDMRHFADNDPGFDATTIALDTYADDIEQARQALGLDKVIVLGHSVHGLIALEYARRYPQHCSHLVVIGSPPVGFGKTLEAGQRYWAAEATEERKAVFAQNWQAAGGQEAMAKLPPSEAVVRTYVTNGPMYWYDVHYDASWLWEGVVTDMAVFGQVFGPMFGVYDLAQEPQPVTVPTLIMLGRYDFIVPYTLWDETERAKITNLTLKVFDHCGHTPQVEVPAEFDAQLIEWLKASTPGG
jgi:proline iminopeptidase